MKETTYILKINIYRDRIRRLLGLSQSTYIDNMLKWFSIEKFKRWYLLIVHKKISPKTCAIRHKLRKIRCKEFYILWL